MNAAITHSAKMTLSKSGTYYFKRTINPMGVPPEICCPLKRNCLIGRLLHNFWVLNKYDVPEGKQLNLHAPEGNQFVTWKLLENEIISFNYRFLIGFWGKIRFKTSVSLHASSIAVNKVFCPKAQGPGTMLFQCKGEPITDNNMDMSFVPSRLIAWDTNEVFELIGSNKVFDIYMNPLHLRSQTHKRYLLDADHVEYQPTNSFVSALRNVYRPRIF